MHNNNNRIPSHYTPGQAARARQPDENDGFDSGTRFPGVSGVNQSAGLPGRRPLHRTSTPWAQQPGGTPTLSHLLSSEHSRYSSSASSGAPSYPQGRTDGRVGPNPVLSSLRSNYSSQLGSYPHSSGNTGPYASGGAAAQYYSGQPHSYSPGQTHSHSPGQPPLYTPGQPPLYTPGNYLSLGARPIYQTSSSTYQAPGFGARQTEPRQQMSELTTELANLALEKEAADNEKGNPLLPIEQRTVAMRRSISLGARIEAAEARKVLVEIEVSRLPSLTSQHTPGGGDSTPPLSINGAPPPPRIPPNADDAPDDVPVPKDEFGIPVPVVDGHQLDDVPEGPDLRRWNEIEDLHTPESVTAVERFHADIDSWVVRQKLYAAYQIKRAQARAVRAEEERVAENKQQEAEAERDREIEGFRDQMTENTDRIDEIDDAIRVAEAEINQIRTQHQNQVDSLPHGTTSDFVTRGLDCQRSTIELNKTKLEQEKNQLERLNTRLQRKVERLNRR